MNPLYAIVLIVALTLGAIVLAMVTIGFYALAAYIVRITGKTAGIADIGRGVGVMIAALTGRHPRSK
jgi:hypothetical protein